MKKCLVLLCVVFLALSSVRAYPHCQVPCGIYDDEMRIEMLKEDIFTVEKSMKTINTLSSEGEKDFNQIVRWVENKDKHADKISDTVTYYFMAQRVKPVDSDDKKASGLYMEKLKALHEILVYAMKAKQTTDLVYVDKMNDTVESFEALYFKE